MEIKGRLEQQRSSLLKGKVLFVEKRKERPHGGHAVGTRSW
jgi:hypothetical protein